MEKKLSETIQYERDIAPYRFIEIYAGVGAGKNTLIEKFAKGEMPGAPKMRVLLITSRRAKADETFKMYLGRDDEYLKLFKNKIGEAVEFDDPYGRRIFATIGNTVCTSAFIAGYLRQVYRADDRRTHIWDMYDMIVIDEIHSLILDATYQPVLFHVFDLINHYIERCVSDKYPDPVCKHLITMTGTIDPVTNYFPDKSITSVFINRMDQCVNIQPENVHFIENSQTIGLLKSVIKDKKRCMYFANSIKRINEFFYSEALSSSKDKLVVSYADEEKREELQEKDNQAWLDMVETENSILDEKHLIPKRFSVFFTTSKYREGVNIEDDIDTMVVESHNRAEVLQMAGRARNGVKDLYIIVDAVQHTENYKKNSFEYEISNLQIDQSKRTDGQSPLNTLLRDVPPDQISDFVELAEQKFPYIRYSYLYKCFLWYETKTVGEKYKREQNRRWSIARQKNELPQYISEWFPAAEIHPFVTEYERKLSESWIILNEAGIKYGEKHRYNKEFRDQLGKKLTDIWGFKYLNKCLECFSNIKCIRVGHNNDEYSFIREEERD